MAQKTESSSTGRGPGLLSASLERINSFVQGNGKCKVTVEIEMGANYMKPGGNC